ncbi:response regulator receiver domain-containing protein [Paucimonas lemoignei]|uniref:Response regulator receiver domain-containing protein n=1 Tax=Paucimonas lemoignei TaxID=29443 RepID=A0A4R3HSX1_PAULE|nr:response regulator [Paucimonas lemoignei]TCS36237.1 response regulator receiver domain-containing protein [Paucimonas lemoignei]
MNRKQALIVDDSKTAQYLLKRMLQEYELRIDVASSAEEALAYLSYNHPAVIFLDQQMTGMTGFEALKTIKANPHTALIPVIMYTSQNDDLFVSQAIALGAQGFLSKGAMHPANLQQVLERLSIRKLGGNPVAATQNPAIQNLAIQNPTAEDTASQDNDLEVVPIREKPVEDPADIDKVRMQIGRLFELHGADIKSSLNSSTQFILKRLSTTIDKSAHREAGLVGNALASIKSVVSAAIASERRKGSMANRVLLTGTIVVMALFTYLLLELQADTEASSKRILAALEMKNVDQSMTRSASMPGISPVKMTVPADAPAVIHPSLLQAISWAQHADFHFDYGEAPLSGARLSNLHQLVQLMADGGYRGTLIVNINFGNFCLEQDEASSWRLARSDVKAANCKMLKDMNPRFPVNDYLTLQYQAFEKNVAAVKDGRVSIRIISNGISTPGVEYPLVTPQTTAGEWNRAALRNNRIAVQIPN